MLFLQFLHRYFELWLYLMSFCRRKCAISFRLIVMILLMLLSKKKHLLLWKIFFYCCSLQKIGSLGASYKLLHE